MTNVVRQLADIALDTERNRPDDPFAIYSNTPATDWALASAAANGEWLMIASFAAAARGVMKVGCVVDPAIPVKPAHLIKASKPMLILLEAFCDNVDPDRCVPLRALFEWSRCIIVYSKYPCLNSGFRIQRATLRHKRVLLIVTPCLFKDEWHLAIRSMKSKGSRLILVAEDEDAPRGLPS